jgi:nitrite reductase/ring-hydroxylating ferredoxin subunit
MKTKTSFFLNSIIVILSTLLITNSCGNRAETVSCFPNSPINVLLNLNLPAYQNLQNVGGYIYVNEQSSGTRGLIVVRTTNSFKVYDRNAPHVCPGSDTTLEVKDNIKIICPSDGAEWILITGEPINISKVPPKTYPVNYDPSTNVLSIYN